MNEITIGPKDFIRGESSSEYVSDGGFSPRSFNLNLTRRRGILDFTPLNNDLAGLTLQSNPIAMTFDKTLAGNDAYVLDSGGNFYTLDAISLTLRQTITADTFLYGNGDILQYTPSLGLNYLMATSQSAAFLLTGSNLVSAAPVTDFWTGLSTGVRHPQEIVEGKWYMGDGNLIHSYDGTTTTSAYVTLPPDVNITTLRKHPDGQHLIAFCGVGQNFSHTRNTPGRVYIVDLTIKRWIREIDTEFQVEGSRLVGGIVYCTYGQNFGYFSGDGISFLKRLTDSTITYSHSIGNMEDVVVVRDGQHVRAFGDLGAGKVWWRCGRTGYQVANTITPIMYRGNNRLIIGYNKADATVYLEQINYDNISGSTPNGTFYANRTLFNAETKIRRIEMLHENSASQFSFNQNDIDNTSIALSDTITVTTEQKTRREIEYATDHLQFFSSGPNGIRLIRIFHEPTN